MQCVLIPNINRLHLYNVYNGSVNKLFLGSAAMRAQDLRVCIFVDRP